MATDLMTSGNEMAEQRKTGERKLWDVKVLRCSFRRTADESMGQM